MAEFLSLPLHDIIILLGASLVAGALNSIAGGGTFFVFPSLLLTGVPPVAANATSSVAVWPGVLASVAGYRSRFGRYRRVLLPMLVIGLIGGWAGAELLLLTPDKHFEVMIPWLLLAATLLFAFGPSLARRLRHEASEEEITRQLQGRGVFSFLSQWAVAVYSGFFGAGTGILYLAVLQWFGLRDIHEMNALKTSLGGAVHGAAVFTFVFSGIIVWPQAVIMILGAGIGGYFGARMALRVPQHYLRYFVIAVATCITLWFFIRPPT